MHNHIQQMADFQRAGVVMQPTGGQRFIDLGVETAVFLHVPVSLCQVQITGAASGQDGVGAVGLLGSQGQVTAVQGIRWQPRHRNVFRGPTAVPIRNFFQLPADVLLNRQQGIQIRPCATLHRTARIKEILGHVTASNSLARFRMACNWSIASILCGDKSMRPLVNMPSPIWAVSRSPVGRWRKK